MPLASESETTPQAQKLQSARRFPIVVRPLLLVFLVMSPIAIWLAQSHSRELEHGAVGLVTALDSSSSRQSLFCFAVTMTTGTEIELMRMQFSQKVGIFKCDTWAVYSAETTWLSKVGDGANTSAIPGPPSVFRPMWGQMRNCNVDYLLRAWTRVVADSRLADNQWVVKVDPDAVFFPDRLRSRLVAHDQPNAKIFVKNCKKLNSMQGPIEVLSREAVKTLVSDTASCKSKITYWNKIGEDQYMTECLGRGDAVGAQPVEDFGMMMDMYCDAPWKFSCENTADVVALHPFKKPADWSKCYAESNPQDVKIRMLLRGKPVSS